LDSNKDGLLTEQELRDLSTDLIEEAFGHTPPGEVNLIGASQSDHSLADIVYSLSEKLPPHIQEFLLRPDKTRQEIEEFLIHGKHTQLSEKVKDYLRKKLLELDDEDLEQQHKEL